MKYLNKKGRARFVEVEDFGVVDLDRVPVSIEKDGQHFTLIWDGRSQHKEDVLAVSYYDMNPYYDALLPSIGNMDANVIREINEGELIEEINYIKYRLEKIEKVLERGGWWSDRLVETYKRCNGRYNKLNKRIGEKILWRKF